MAIPLPDVGAADSSQRPSRAEARLTGRVTSTDGDVPLEDVVVRIRTVSRQEESVTDGTGAFTFEGLPVGAASVSFKRPGYQLGEPGTAGIGADLIVQLASSQNAPLNVRMSRRATISGTVRSSTGAGTQGLRVYAFDLAQLTSQSFAPSELPSAITDIGGEYRLADLAPGVYVVWADDQAPQAGLGAAAGQPSPQDIDRILGSIGGAAGARPTVAPKLELPAPVFFPGTFFFNDATRFKLALASQERNIDFVYRASPVMRIAGQILGNPGVIRSSRIAITPLSTVLGAGRGPIVSQPDADGHFEIRNLSTGVYRILAFSGIASSQGAGDPAIGSSSIASRLPIQWYAFAEVKVDSEDLGGLFLSLQPAKTIKGKLDSADPIFSDRVKTETQVVFMPRADWGLGVRGLVPSRSAFINKDGTFAITGVLPGTYDVEARMPETGGQWWLESAVAGGVDCLDGSLRIEPTTQDVPDLSLTVTRSESVLKGHIVGGLGPTRQTFVVVFPRAELTFSSARRRQFVIPDIDGGYEFHRLPSGEYLIAVVRDFDAQSWSDSDLIATLRKTGVSVTVKVGVVTTQDLQIVGRD